MRWRAVCGLWSAFPARHLTRNSPVRSRVAIVGECKWTNEPMPARVLEDLETFKLPAMRERDVRFALAARDDVTLVSAERLVGDLDRAG